MNVNQFVCYIRATVTPLFVERFKAHAVMDWSQNFPRGSSPSLIVESYLFM